MIRNIKFSSVVKYGCAWLIPAVLMALAFMPEFQPQAHYRTLRAMSVLERWVQLYRQEFKIIAPSLREVVEYSATQGPGIASYDHYGYKLDIRYLDQSTTLIKSWGNINFSDKNHKFARNLFLAPKEWAELFPVVIHSYPQPPVLYQPAQLISSTSYNKHYSARLFVHHQTNQRTLVVVHNDKKRDPIFLHTSHQPEELMWFPGSSLLAFTSHPEFSLKGPLHIYDVERDELRSVKFGKESGIDHKKSTTPKPYVAALAGAEGDKLYLYITPYAGGSLHPDRLFRSRNLYEVQATVVSGRFRAAVMHSASQQEGPVRALRREYSAPKMGAGGGLQRSWFNLKPAGTVAQSIRRWHEFALRAQKEASPLLPYALITLISLCEQASFQDSALGTSLSAQMYRHALAYAKLAAETPSYPTWLRLVSWEAWDRLKLRQRTSLDKIIPTYHPLE